MPDTTLAAVTAAAKDHGDTRYKKGQESRQPEVDALTAQVATIGAERDVAVRALAEHMATHVSPPLTPKGDVSYRDLVGATPSERFGKAQGKVVTLTPGVIDGGDFATPANYPVYSMFGYQLRGLLGSGRDHTRLQVKPNASTRAGGVPKAEAGKENTNPYYVLRVDGKHNPELADFAVHGTDQGHCYNGVILYEGTSRLHDVLIKGIPGDAAVNPGETFPLNIFRQTSGTYQRFEVDGRDTTDTPVTASGVGINFGRGHLLEDFHVHHTAHGAGIAAYECADLTFRDGITEDCRYYGLNFENVTGTVLVERHTFARCARDTPWASERGAHVGIATNRGTATYTFVDPTFDSPKLVIRCTGYKGGKRTQDTTAIRLLIDGKDRPDLLDIRTA